MAHTSTDVELFISCDDHLDKIAGVHNVVCSASGLAIMAQPARTYLVAGSVLGME